MEDLTKKKQLDDDLRNQPARGAEGILGELQGGAGGGYGVAEVIAGERSVVSRTTNIGTEALTTDQLEPELRTEQWQTYSIYGVASAA